MRRFRREANSQKGSPQFQKMKAAFIDRGIPVILGECGGILRTEHEPTGRYRTY